MKYIIITLSLLIASFTLFAQQKEEGWCGTDGYNEGLNLTPKERQESEEFIENLRNATKEFYENGSELTGFEKNDDDIYIIPLVVHVIHDNGVGNISYEQIEDGVRILNEDLRRKNADTSLTRDIFKTHAADSKIEFRLAKIDPNGNCTNGVVRINDPYYAYNGNDDAKALSVWPPNRYFNYWLANFLPTDGAGSLLGYARFPWWGVNNRYGVMQRNDEFGSIGTAAGKSGRTTVHEVGHCFGLYHTFQSGCGNNCSDSGDEVCDTPPVSESSWACNTDLNTCSNDMNGPSPYDSDVADQIENYMSYNSCQNMLSSGQVLRMDYVLNNFESLENLWSPENIEATGVNTPGVLCIADFNASFNTVCIGQSIDFNDMSYHGQTSWEWNFEGGSPATSTDANPTITYNSPGVYEVSLTASDGTGSVSEVKTNFIRVLDSPEALPFIEGFEEYTNLINSPWMIENPGNNASFELVTNVAHSGDNSVKLANFGQSAGNIDELISSPIDLSTITDEMTLSFRYAYRKRHEDNVDWLRIFITNDCGVNNSWSLRRNIRGNQLSDQIATSAWEPQSMDDWTTVHMTNVTSQFWVDLFRVKFQFESDGGNNFFLDDINIYSGGPSELSIAEENEFSEFNVFPNPASNEVNVSFSLESAQNTKISLLNTLGQTVKDFDIQANSGNNLVLIGTEEFDAGVYIIKVQTQGKEQTKRLIIK